MHFTIPLCDLQEFSMEYKDPMFELLSSLEQIVFKDETRKITLTQKPILLPNLNSYGEGRD